MEALIPAGNIPAPSFELDYERRNITVAVTPFLLSLTYTDNLDGDEADSIEVQLEDVDGRWTGDWYPGLTDRLRLRMGYQGAALLDCGQFEIDEIDIDGPPSTVRIRALSAAVSKPLRTENNRAFEKTTLAAIAREIAGRHGLTVTGSIAPVEIERVTQMKQDDLKFLQRLARDYGHAFSVRGDQLVFQQLEELRAAAPVATLKPGDLSRYTFRDKIKGTPKNTAVAYHDPAKKALVSYSLGGDGELVSAPSADTAKLTGRVESKAQAKAKAQARQRRDDDEATTGGLTLSGDPRLVAGNNLALAGFGVFDGRWQIKASRHAITRSGGYVSDVDIRRVERTPAAKAKAAKAKKQLVVYGLKDGQVVKE